MGTLESSTRPRIDQSLSLTSPLRKHKRNTDSKGRNSTLTSENFAIILYLALILAYPAGYRTPCPRTPYAVTEDRLRHPIHCCYRCSFTFSNHRDLQFHTLFCERPRFHCCPLCPHQYRTRVAFENHIAYKHEFDACTTHRFCS